MALFVDQLVVFQGGVNCGGDGVDLGCVSGSEHRQNTEGGEENRQPVPFRTKAIFDVVHRAADQITVLISFAEMNCQGYLGEFGTHAKNCGNPHPEDCARAADGNGACHTGNVSGADGSSQRCTDCLERGHGTVGGITLAENTSDGDADCVREFADLQEAQAKA